MIQSIESDSVDRGPGGFASDSEKCCDNGGVSKRGICADEQRSSSHIQPRPGREGVNAKRQRSAEEDIPVHDPPRGKIHSEWRAPFFCGVFADPAREVSRQGE